MRKMISYGIVLITILAGFGTSIPALSQQTQASKNFITEPIFNDASAYQQYYEIENMNGPKEWSIVNSFLVPEGASGLAYDGVYLYCGIYGTNGNNIYRISPINGSYSLAFSGTQEDAYGLTYDGQYLWTTDHPGSSSTPAKAMKFDWGGGLLTQFDLPTHYVSGIAYDNGNFWVAQYYPDPSIIYKVNSAGTILQQFTAPNNQPWDLCIENQYLWMADYWGDSLYRINKTTGGLIESHASEGVDPAGIVYDGQYLWYCDNGADYNYDTLYKVDLLGGGTPEITVPVTTHDYGPVTIGDSVAWNATVQNTGTASLSITDVVIPGSADVTCPVALPVTIPPSGQTVLPFVYEPQTATPLDVIVTIQSNDPLNPEVDVTLLGNGVSSGPDILLAEASHDYGLIRLHATKRWFMEIQNVGDAILTIQSITSNDAQFYVDDDVTFPLSVAIVGSVDVPIWYQPGVNEPSFATLTITNNDPDENPLLVPVQGTGVEAQYPIGEQLWSYYITTGYDNSPKAMSALPDVTGDGISDVIVCSEDDYVRCFNGNAYGTAEVIWEHEIYAGSVYSQKGLTITEDIDNDGYSDVVVGAAWGGRLITTLSGKTGEALWVHDTHEYGEGGWVYQVDCRFDYNGDGVLDVLASTGDDSYDTGPKRVYCLNGLTGVSLWECYLSGPGFAVIGIQDFTGDGIPDAMAGASNEGETIGKAYGINGATGTIAWTVNTPGSSVWALEQLDDVSGDGISDVVIGDFSGHIYGLNAVNGNELWNAIVGNVIIVRFDKLADVNNNGHPEVVPAHFGTSVKVYDGYTGESIWSHSVADKPACVAVSQDISGDNINDIFVGTLYSNNYCYFLNGVDGAELDSFAVSDPVDAIAAIPDIIGDRSMEMVVGGRDGSVMCYSGGLDSNPIQAEFSADPAQGPVPLTVQFTDLSTAYDTVITSWQWDFDNDGTIDSTEQNPPEWTYDEVGVYSVSLRISDGEFFDTELKEDYIVGQNPLVADFSADVTQGVEPLTVHFTDLSTEHETTITSWQWDFNNDGTIDSVQQNPVWTYNQEGTYTVSLTVSDGQYTDTAVKTNYIVVTPGQGRLSIGNVTGGLLKVNVELKNNGTADVSDVNWSITISNGIILLGRTAQDVLPSLPIGSAEVISDRPLIGFGPIKITISAEAPGVEPVTKTAHGFVFLFFVLIT